ncbi:hypothetical protein ACJ72_05323 [Emergomyces africanus]|uniref:Uncharacterized protein n=1 Tax=Emergomyces africanus TaxID=1955775 RepID=A0A1B7NU96_9EURO|nr:hypothetical protein ACJ72_05323 [Emergomyces africanus]
MACRSHSRTRCRTGYLRHLLQMDFSSPAQDDGKILGLLTPISRGEADSNIEGEHRVAATTYRVCHGHASHARGHPGGLEFA